MSGLNVAGKTGTTQIVSLDVVEGLEEEEIPIRYRDHALFAAFAPVEAPEIALVVLVEHAGAGGGAVAAPIAGKVLRRWFEKKQESGAQRQRELEQPATQEAEAGVETPGGTAQVAVAPEGGETRASN